MLLKMENYLLQEHLNGVVIVDVSVQVPVDYVPLSLWHSERKILFYFSCTGWEGQIYLS